MFKTSGRSGVWDFGFSSLVLVSGFGFRISDFEGGTGKKRPFTNMDALMACFPDPLLADFVPTKDLNVV
jgi:hypothetical protein